MRACDTPLVMIVFLSTPSTRRATITLHNNPQNYIISIHALHEEGDEVMV